MTVYLLCTVRNSLTSLIMSHIVGLHAAVCGLQCSNLRGNKDFNGKQGQKRIRMGIAILEMFI